VLTGFGQVRRLGFSLKEVLGKLRQHGGGTGSVRPFQAVTTALAPTVGVGNIAGVATAIFMGGPGSVFWLWLSGLFGMATRYAEIVVALHYREPDDSGTMRGGAMYVLKKGLGLPWLGAVFALLTSVAAFGIGNMVQANSVADALRATFGIATNVTGIGLVVLTAIVVTGGLLMFAFSTLIGWSSTAKPASSTFLEPGRRCRIGACGWCSCISGPPGRCTSSGTLRTL